MQIESEQTTEDIPAVEKKKKKKEPKFLSNNHHLLPREWRKCTVSAELILNPMTG